MIRYGIACCLMVGVISGCSFLPDSSPEPTPTPERPIVREAAYESASNAFLTVTLSDLTLLKMGDDLDTQVLAVLADGGGNPSYVLYPSNQPGVSDRTLALADYPLGLNVSSEKAGLWVLALRHSAYAVSQRMGQAMLAARLAAAYDQMLARSTPPDKPLAAIVAAEVPLLLDWFGEIEVLGELSLALEAAKGWSVGENRAQAPDDGFRLSYTVSVNRSDVLPTPAATSELSPLMSVSIFEQDLPGYRRVISETFENGRSTVKWFTGSDPTYTASLVDGAYQILLTGVDESRGIALSWGSIQDLIFDDYVVRARMRVLEPTVTARYGLWLHYQNEFTFLFFGLETTGRYRIARFQRVYTEFAPWTSHSAINIGGGRSNDVEVRMDGTSYTMAVNGQPLVTVSDGVLSKGRIAFFCFAESVPATCQLERLEVWIPEDQPFPKPTDTPSPP